MAAHALVSMSPGPVVVEEKVSEPFGSPTRGQKRGRALFPPTTGGGAGGTASLDDEALGALDGLFMLADATTFAETAGNGGDGGGSGKKRSNKRKPKAEKPPLASPARGGGKGKGGGWASSLTPVKEAAARGSVAAVGAAAAAAAKGMGDGSPDGLPDASQDSLPDGLRTPGGAGTSRRSSFKSTPPVAGAKTYVSGLVYATPGRPGGPGRGGAVLAGLGGVGPFHVGETRGLEEGREGVGGRGGGGGLPSLAHRGGASSARRRWFLSENFYSSMDRSWFANTGFQSFLNHLGLGHKTKFKRSEWRVIRRSLSLLPPRRLSLSFLRGERWGGAG